MVKTVLDLDLVAYSTVARILAQRRTSRENENAMLDSVNGVARMRASRDPTVGQLVRNNA